jgi:uncharacterized protein YebE (UPF0316 family)
MSPALIALPILPLFIFLAEVCVVTLCTVRIIFIGRGMKVRAALLGFCEVSIWLFAIGQIMQNLSDLGCYMGFAGGFALGNYLGVAIEQKLALGNLVVRVITKKDGRELAHRLRVAGYGVTSVDGEGATGPVQVILTVIRRKQLKSVVGMLTAFDRKVFYSVDDLQSISQGNFPTAQAREPGPVPHLLRWVDAPFHRSETPTYSVGHETLSKSA